MNKFLAVLGIAVPAASFACAAGVAGIYSPRQAADGQVVFTQNCASCHGSDLEGGVGSAMLAQDFAAPADHNTVGELFSFLSAKADDIKERVPGRGHWTSRTSSLLFKKNDGQRCAHSSYGLLAAPS